MSAEKKMTVQEMALGLASDVFGDVDYYSRMGKMPLGAVDRVAEQIKQALLSYAAQEVKSATKELVEALENSIHGGRGMMDNLMKVHIASCPIWNMTCTICRDSAVATNIFRRSEEALTAHREIMKAKHGRKGE